MLLQFWHITLMDGLKSEKKVQFRELFASKAKINVVFFFKSFRIEAGSSSEVAYRVQWAKTWKKSNFKSVFEWLHNLLPQRIKSTFLFFIFSSLGVLSGDPLLEKISKNVDFSLWDKQCIVLPKWTFFAF